MNTLKRCYFLTKDSFRSRNSNTIVYQFESGDQSVYHISNEMKELLPDSCPQFKFQTCAVVGNSGTLLFDTMGEEINAAEMVYRFNQAPTETFEAFVGNKTTFESLNSKHAGMLARNDPGYR